MDQVLLLDYFEGVLVRRGRGDDGGVDGLTALGPWLTALVCSGHGCVEGGEVAHHAFVLILLVCMDGLCVLAQIVETGELF